MVSNTIIAKNVIRYILYKKIDESVGNLIKEIESSELEKFDVETQDDTSPTVYNGNSIKNSLETAVKTGEAVDKNVKKVVRKELKRLEELKLPGLGDARSILLNVIKDKLQNQIKIVLSTAVRLVDNPRYSDPNSEKTKKLVSMKKRHFYNADLSKLVCDKKHPLYKEIKRITKDEIFTARCEAYKKLMETFPEVVEVLPEIDFSKIFNFSGKLRSKKYAELVEQTIYPRMVQMRWKKQEDALEAYLKEFGGQEKIMNLINEDMTKYRKMLGDFENGECEDPEKNKWILIGEPPSGLSFYKISPKRMRTVFWFLLNRILAYGEYEITNNIENVYEKPLIPAQVTS